MTKSNKNPDVVFILGCPRSGTTWMWGLLTSHPYIVPIVREDFFPDEPSVVDGKIVTSETHAFSRTKNLSIISRIILEKSSLFPGKTLVEKTPVHSLFIDKILSIFPHSKFIVMQRNPFAIINSMIHSNIHVSADAFSAVELFLSYHSALSVFSKNPQFFFVNYDLLLSHSFHVLSDILLFLSLPSSADILNKMITENHLKSKVSMMNSKTIKPPNAWKTELSQSDIDYISSKIPPGGFYA